MISSVAWTVSGVVAIRLIVKFIKYYNEQKRISKFFDNYPEPFKEKWMGMAGEFEKYTGSEGAIRSKNAACDRLRSDQAGGMVGKFGPGLRIFITANPETAKFLMTLKPEMVEKAGLSDMLFGDDPKGFIGGLLYEEGAAWHRSRKILTEEFNQASLDSYVDAMDESIKAYSDKLIKMGADQGVPAINNLTNQLTLEVMLKTVFGDRSFDLISVNGDHKIFRCFISILHGFNYKLTNIMVGLLLRVPVFGPLIGKSFIPPIKDMYNAFTVRDDYIDELIKSKRAELESDDFQLTDGFWIQNSYDHRDLITVLLKCTDQDNKPFFSPEQIRAQLFTFLFAGFETTSAAIQSLLFHLGDEPEWVEKICQEFESLSRVISPKTLKQMPITTAFIRETVRLANIVDILIPRKVTVDIQLPNGHIMPKGTQWGVDVQRMCQNQKGVWGEEPFKFDPNRFLDKNADSLHPYQNIPFSAGRRSCIGRHFAMQELKIVTCRLATELKIKNEVLRPTPESGRPEKAIALTWKIAPDSLKQSFMPIS